MIFNIPNQYFNNLLIFNFIDLIEILFFSTLIYFCSLWLRNDRQKHMLATFYCTLSLLFVAHFVQMQTVTSMLIMFLPVFFTIFFMIHQQTLQKNFIAIKNMYPSKTPNLNNWVDEFMRSCLNAMGNNKKITAIIESKDSLNEFINAPFLISTNINKELMDMLISSPSFDEQKMIWLNCQGQLQAVNTLWNIKNHDLWLTEDINDSWQQDAITFTSKIDSLLFRTNPEKRTFDIVMQGKLIEDISPNNFLQIIQHFAKRSELELLKRKGQNNNEAKLKNPSSKQQPFA